MEWVVGKYMRWTREEAGPTGQGKTSGTKETLKGIRMEKS